MTGDLDCPEGLALNGDQLYVASFLDSRIVAFDLSTKRGRTLALGPPVGVDYETLAFVPAAFDDEPSARAARQRAAEIWNEDAESAPFVDRLRGPEQLVVIGNATLAVSSLHNDSVLTLDLATGELIEVIVDGATDDELSGPLGVASAGAAVAAAADMTETKTAATKTADSSWRRIGPTSSRWCGIAEVSRHCSYRTSGFEGQ